MALCDAGTSGGSSPEVVVPPALAMTRPSAVESSGVPAAAAPSTLAMLKPPRSNTENATRPLSRATVSAGESRPIPEMPVAVRVTRKRRPVCRSTRYRSLKPSGSATK